MVAHCTLLVLIIFCKKKTRAKRSLYAQKHEIPLCWFLAAWVPFLGSCHGTGCTNQCFKYAAIFQLFYSAICQCGAQYQYHNTTGYCAVAYFQIHLLSPLHFIEATMEQPRNNTIKIHILQLETQLQVKLIQKTNLY